MFIHIVPIHPFIHLTKMDINVSIAVENTFLLPGMTAIIYKQLEETDCIGMRKKEFHGVNLLNGHIKCVLRDGNMRQGMKVKGYGMVM